MNKKEAKAFQKRLVGITNKVIEVLTEEEGLRVCDASEILLTCNNIIKERTFAAMNAEESRPLCEALEHLRKPKIHAPGAGDISAVSGSKLN